MAERNFHTFCSEQSVVKWGEDAALVGSLRCRRWSCDICEPNRRRKLTREAYRGKPAIFLTLTIAPHLLNSRVERARALVNAWRNLRKRAIREAKRDLERHPYPYVHHPEWPKAADHRGRVRRQVSLHAGRVPFLAVFEEHKSGEPHLHICVRAAWIGQKWLSACMKELIDSPIVDVRAVKDARKVAYYVAKYVGKQPRQFGTLKRYWRSLDYLPANDNNETEDRFATGHWRVEDWPVGTILQNLMRHGYQITAVGDFYLAEARAPPQRQLERANAA